MIETYTKRKLRPLRNDIGTITDNENGVEYELTTSMSNTPIVFNPVTRKQFSLSWTDLVDLAKAAGIDK